MKNQKWISVIIKYLLLFLLFKVGFTKVFGIYIVKGNSMYPSLRDGDLCITYKLEPYTLNEVIAYKNNDEIRFGRIVAKQADTVEITQENILLVNGIQPAEEIFYPTVPAGEGQFLTEVSDGHWFVLNDCRTDLSDSRTYGCIENDVLQGKLIFLLRRRGF